MIYPGMHQVLGIPTGACRVLCPQDQLHGYGKAHAVGSSRQKPMLWAVLGMQPMLRMRLPHQALGAKLPCNSKPLHRSFSGSYPSFQSAPKEFWVKSGINQASEYRIQVNGLVPT